MPICPSCGTENSASNAFCPKCGTTLSSASGNAAPVWEAPASNSTPVWDASPEHVAAVASAMGDDYGKQDAPVIFVPGGDETPVSDNSGSPVHKPINGSPVDTLPTQSRILGLISMICGICAAAMFWMFSGFYLSPVAIILSIMANKKNTSTVKNSKATIGMVTGIIGAVLTLFMVIAISEG